MFAGQTLAQIADALAADPSLAPAARAELTARINRPNARPSSVKRATAALARMDAGTSVAIPARPEKAPKSVKAPKKPAPTPTPKAQAARVRNDATGEMRPVVTQAQACKLAADLLRSYGYPVPRALSTLAKGRTPQARTNA